MKRLFLTGMTFMMMAFWSGAVCSAEDPLDVNMLIDEALAHNPEIAASQNKKEAMWKRPPQAKAWEDPQITLGVGNVPVDDFEFNKIDMTQKEVSISQQIPFPGVTSLKEKIAIQEAKSTDQEFANTQFQVVKAVKEAYAELYVVNAHIRTANKNKGLLQKFIDIARAKYEVGKGLQQDILKAQVEHSKFIERLIGLEQKQATLIAEFNRLLGRDPSAALTGTPSLQKKSFPYTAEELERMALENNPVLISMQNVIERNEADHKLAKKMYVPSFNVTAAYGLRENYTLNQPPYTATLVNPDGTSNQVQVRTPSQRAERDDVFSFFVGMNIPIWFHSKQNKKVAETNLLIGEAKSQYEALKNEMFYRIRDLVAKEARGTKLIELYQTGIIPQATQSLESAIAGYEVGTIDFLALLDTQVTLCNYEVQVSEELSSYEKYLAELEVVVGKRLF